MAKLPEEVKKAIDKQDVFPIATCSSEGVSNVVYVAYLKVIYDETMGITTRVYYEGATEQDAGSVHIYDGAGISNSYSISSISFIQKF